MRPLKLQIIALWMGALVLMAACAPAAPNADAESASVVLSKALATVDVPPTPDRAQREATRRALPATATALPATPTPTASPYIGVFLGTPEDNNAALSLVDLSLPTKAPETLTDGCDVPFDEAFGTGWRSNPSVVRRVGCPLQQRFGFAANVQVFERGVMYQRIDTNEVWAVQPGNIGTGKYWYFNQPQPVGFGGIIAPPGLRVPGDVFGGVWSGNTVVSQAIGYATTPEQTADLNLQRFTGGALLLDVTVGQVFILFDDGDAFGPY